MKILIVNFNSYSGTQHAYCYNGTWLMEDVTEEFMKSVDLTNTFNKEEMERLIGRYADTERYTAYVFFNNGVLIKHGIL